MLLNLLLLSFHMAACSESSAGGPELRLPESDVPVVRNSGAGAWSEAETWQAEVALRIGGRDEAMDHQFGRVYGLAVDSAGRVLGLDGITKEIKVFSPRGALRCTMGRMGQGPGEIQNGIALMVGAGDTVWVRDNANRRYSAFSVCGRFERMLPQETRGVIYGTTVLDEQVGLVDWSFGRSDWGRIRRMNEIGARWEYRPLQVDLESGSVDSFPSIVREYEIISERIPAPFAGTVKIAPNGKGAFWFANSERYVLYRREWSGDTTLIITRDDARYKVVDDRAVDTMDAKWRRLYPDTDPPRRSQYPNTMPIIANMVSNGDHLLVLTDEAGSAPGRWLDIFDESSGTYLGKVELPYELDWTPRPVLVGRSLYAVVLDDLDVPSVVRIDF